MYCMLCANINILLFLMAFINDGFACKEIYISRTIGHDKYYCGNSPNNQCKTLSYTVNHIAEDGDVLYLHGGNRSRITYELTVPLKIGISLIIKQQVGSRMMPIITTERETFFNLFEFYHTPERNVTVELESIELWNINILKFNKCNVSMIINNCTIDMLVKNMSHKNNSTSSSNNLSLSNSTKENVTLPSVNLQITNTIIKCHNHYLIHDQLQGINFENVIISKSVLNGCSIFFNSSSNNSILHLEIQDVTFKGVVNKSVAYINKHSNIIFRNVTFTNNNGKGMDNALFRVSIPFEFSKKSNIFFDSLKFQLNKNLGRLFYSKNTFVNGISLVLSNNTHTDGTLLVNVTGTINGAIIYGNRQFGYGIFTVGSKMSFGKLTINKNQFSKESLNFDTSNITLDCINVMESHYSQEKHVLYVDKSGVVVKTITIKNVTVPKAEVVGMRKGALEIDSLHVSNSFMHQTLLLKYGSLLVKSGIIHNNNNSNSTLVGSVDAESFDIRSLTVTNNLIGDKVFHIENVGNIVFHQIQVSNNSMNEIFHMLKGNVFIDGVTIRDNIVRGHGKALSFTDETERSGRKNFIVTIKNFYARFHGFTGLYQSNNYLEIDMRSSNLTVRNTSISVHNIYVPSIKVVKLVFSTKNPNVHPQIDVVCPINYNLVAIPIVKVTIIDYAVDCQRCQKDTYSLLRGQLKLKVVYFSTGKIHYFRVDPKKEEILMGRDVINNSRIDTTWVDPYNITTIISTNQTKDLKCHPCPSGGDCLNGTRSQGNYFGYKRSNTNLAFISCPSKYCCSKLGKECTSYDTCNKNRQGVLCGQCQPGFYESLFSSNCVKNYMCTEENQSIFWIVFCASAILLSFIVCFAKDIITLLRFSMNRVRRPGQRNQTVVVRDSKIMFLIRSENDSQQEVEIKSSRMSGIKDHTLEKFLYNGLPFKNDCYNVTNDQEYTMSGLVQILIGFFQIDAVFAITLEGYSKMKYEVLLDIFNLEFFLYEVDSLCPFHSIGAVGKLLFRKILIFLAIIIIVTVALLVISLVNQFQFSFTSMTNNNENKHKLTQELIQELTNLPMRYKLVLTYLKILLFAYKNIAFVSITLMSCPHINNTPVLYIDGNIQCYREKWQLFNYVFFVIWIIPFPLALPFLYDLMKREAISLWKFLLCVAVPLATPFWYYKRRNAKSQFLGQLDDGNLERIDSCYEREIRNRLYAIFEEPYNEIGSLFWWVSFGLYERLIVAAISTLLTDPTKRMCTITIVVILFLWLHFHLQPYKKEMSLLRKLDVTSYICLCFHSTSNLFRAVVYNFDLSPLTNPVEDVLDIFGIFGYIMTPLTLSLIYLIAKSSGYVWKEISENKMK